MNLIQGKVLLYYKYERSTHIISHSTVGCERRSSSQVLDNLEDIGQGYSWLSELLTFIYCVLTYTIVSLGYKM